MSATNAFQDILSYSHGNRDYVFTLAVPEYFICEICHGVLKECLTTSCCLHSFCDSCLQQARGFKNSCPSCRADHFQTTEDKKTDRLVGSLKVRCRFSVRGCEWQGELSEVEKSHIERNCPFALVKCPLGCDGKVERKDVDAHSADECPKRLVACLQCGHKRVWDEFRDHLDDRGQCPMEYISCMFQDFGCKEKVRRCEMDDHNISGVHAHVLMIAETYRMEMQSLQAEVSVLKSEVQEKERTVEELKGEVCTLQESLQSCVSSISNRMDIGITDKTSGAVFPSTAVRNLTSGKPKGVSSVDDLLAQHADLPTSHPSVTTSESPSPCEALPTTEPTPPQHTTSHGLVATPVVTMVTSPSTRPKVQTTSTAPPNLTSGKPKGASSVDDLLAQSADLPTSHPSVRTTSGAATLDIGRQVAARHTALGYSGISTEPVMDDIGDLDRNTLQLMKKLGKCQMTGITLNCDIGSVTLSASTEEGLERMRNAFLMEYSELNPPKEKKNSYNVLDDTDMLQSHAAECDHKYTHCAFWMDKRAKVIHIASRNETELDAAYKQLVSQVVVHQVDRAAFFGQQYDSGLPPTTVASGKTSSALMPSTVTDTVTPPTLFTVVGLNPTPPTATPPTTSTPAQGLSIFEAAQIQANDTEAKPIPQAVVQPQVDASKLSLSNASPASVDLPPSGLATGPIDARSRGGVTRSVSQGDVMVLGNQKIVY